MKRRIFIRNLLGSGTFMGLNGLVDFNSIRTNIDIDLRTPFHINFAPQLGMFQHKAGSKPGDQIKFMSSNGFRVIEDMGFLTRSKLERRQIMNSLQKEDLTLGTFIGHRVDWHHPTLCTGRKTDVRRFMTEIKESVSIAKRTNCKQLCVFPGPVSLTYDFQTQRKNLIENLKRALELVVPNGIELLLVPINPSVYPGQFISSLEEASYFSKAAGSNACRILFNTYSHQRYHGNLIESISKYWNEIGYFQLADVPGKKEPLTGEINFIRLLSFIQESGYKGILGMDHGLSKDGLEGENQILRNYRVIDSWLKDHIEL
ncbi:MAG: TIM barrel protein [Bacteroidota bacterium]